MARALRELLLACLLIGLLLATAGCGAVGGPTFWWDDEAQARLPDDYELPPPPQPDEGAYIEGEASTAIEPPKRSERHTPIPAAMDPAGPGASTGGFPPGSSAAGANPHE